MSGPKRFMHRTWSLAPLNYHIVSPLHLVQSSFNRLCHFPPVSSDEMNTRYFVDTSELRQHDRKVKLLGSEVKQPLQFKNVRTTVPNCSFVSAPLSSSAIRWPSFPMNVAKFCTSSTTKDTTTNLDNTKSAAGGGAGETVVGEGDSISFVEARRLMRLVNVESLKMKLGMEGKEVIAYSELLEACESMGVARSMNEAIAFARVLDEAGVILLFRDKVYLHPDKVVDLVRRAVPLALTPEDDPRRGELKKLQEEKENIDFLAHRQVRRILWSGLGVSILQVGLFFRLTFWEFSWDVMEPIAFFTTASGIVIGYAYFLFTSRDPSYQDLMKRLFLSRQRNLFKKQRFDVDRFLELQKKCKSPLDIPRALKNQAKLDLEPDVFHAH